MPVPNIYEDGSGVHGTGALTVPWGTHNDTFYGILVITSNGETIGTPTGSGQSWTLIGECYEGTPGAAGSVGIAAYYCKATSGSMGNVTVPDSGDHTSAKMWMIQNAAQSGNPINFADTQTVATATTAISFAVPDSTVQNCLVLIACANGVDSATSQASSGWTNSSLSSVGSAGSFQTANGNGGGYMGGVGSKATAGACGTFAHAWANNTKQANIVFAISDTATESGAVGSSAGAGTATGVGASTAAAVGSAAGVASVTGAGADGYIGTAAGVASATAEGRAIINAVGTAAGVAATIGKSDETLMIDIPGTLPGSVANGSWTVPFLENGVWKFEITFTSANGATYAGFHALLSSGASSGYGLWIVDSNLEFYDTSDNQIFSRAMTWSAGQKITILMDMVGNDVTISGATTGNGTFSFTPGAAHWEAGSTLWVCQWNGSFTTSATIGDVYGTYGTASAGGPVAGVATATAVSEAGSQGVGSAAGTSTATAGGDTASGVRLGSYGSARELFGSAATSVTLSGLTTVTGSALLICTGGRLTDLATAPTDNKGNTYTAVGSPVEFHDWPDYGIRVWQCLDANGGTGHNFTQTMTQFDEVTIAVVEIRDGVFLQDFASDHPDNGEALTAPDVTITGPAELVSFFCGDAPTGATTSISPSNGYTVRDISTFDDHPNGYVPIGIITRSATTAGDYGTTYTESPDQGAIIWNIAIQGSEVNAVGSSAGTATGTATGASTVAQAGTSTGAATGTGVGASTATAAGTSAGVGAASAVGEQAAPGAGTSAGTSTATATSASTAASPGASAGAATVTGVGAAGTTAVGTVAGTSTASAVGASRAGAAGLSVATGDAAATGASRSAQPGASAGVAEALGVGAATSTAVGSSSGAATATGAGNAVGGGEAVGTSPGTSTATAVGLSTADAAASAFAISSAGGVGRSLADAVGTAAGTSTATSSAGDSAGFAEASSSATGVGASLAAAAGTSVGASVAVGVSDAFSWAQTATASFEEVETSGSFEEVAPWASTMED